MSKSKIALGLVAGAIAALGAIGNANAASATETLIATANVGAGCTFSSPTAGSMLPSSDLKHLNSAVAPSVIANVIGGATLTANAPTLAFVPSDPDDVAPVPIRGLITASIPPNSLATVNNDFSTGIARVTWVGNASEVVKLAQSYDFISAIPMGAYTSSSVTTCQ